jgi:hypothetical protein
MADYIVMPEGCWPSRLGNPKHAQVIHPSLTKHCSKSAFEQDYLAKFKNRQLRMMAVYGYAILCLDRRLEFRVCTGQATILLRIAEESCSFE